MRITSSAIIPALQQKISFRIRAQYIYGLTNMLNKLNNNNLQFTGENTEFKGNQNIITLSALFTL
jgi:hypothetical protein